MQIFDGNKEAKKLDKIISKKILEEGISNALGVIIVGKNSESERYVNAKKKLCDSLGIPMNIYRLNATLSDSTIETQVKDIAYNENLSGVIIQLPLPRNSLKKLLNLIPTSKDLDVLSDKSFDQFVKNTSKIKPPVVRALERFLLVNKIKTDGLEVAIVGAGGMVGGPVSYFLLNNKAKITILDEDPYIREEYSAIKGIKLKDNYKAGNKINAELVIAATSKANLIDGEDLAKDTHLVDFGFSIVNSKILGNFNTDSKTDHLGSTALVPGGMGPLVVRYLIMNFLNI